MWLAGGGIKPGMTYGATDELGFHVVDNPVHVHDLQATILHLLGFDHEKLTLPLRRPRLPPDRRAREGGEGYCGLAVLFLEFGGQFFLARKVDIDQDELLLGRGSERWFVKD